MHLLMQLACQATQVINHEHNFRFALKQQTHMSFVLQAVEAVGLLNGCSIAGHTVAVTSDSPSRCGRAAEDAWQ